MPSLLLNVFAALALTAFIANVADAAMVTISGRSDIYSAGQTVVPSDGTPAQEVAVSGGPGILHVLTATGEVFGGCAPSNGPDGGNSCAQPASTTDADNGLSPITHIGAFFVAGVFLGPEAPTEPAPVALDFTAAALGQNFSELRPELAQAFFIGDGLTDAGAVQHFFVPTGATRLFLGTLDNCGGGGTLRPGCYFDNSGSFEVGFEIVPVPEPASYVLFGAGCLLLIHAVRRRQASGAKLA